jgi:hypothetical protein
MRDSSSSEALSAALPPLAVASPPPASEAFFRAGHAHAGVLVTPSLVGLLLVDATQLTRRSLHRDEGKVRFTSGDESVDVDAGTVVVVPIGVPHTFSNPFDEMAVFMCPMTPDLYVQYFRDLSELPLNDQGMLNPADIARTMARYATDVIRPD